MFPFRVLLHFSTGITKYCQATNTKRRTLLTHKHEYTHTFTYRHIHREKEKENARAREIQCETKRKRETIIAREREYVNK